MSPEEFNAPPDERSSQAPDDWLQHQLDKIDEMLSEVREKYEPDGSAV